MVLLYFFSTFSKGTQLFNFIKSNVIQKLAHKVKYISLVKLMEVWSCFSEI